MPPMAQWVMVPGCPAMMRVVTGRVQEHNNDVAIAFLNPLPQQQMDYEIRNILENFINVHLGIPTTQIQPCPHGQAYDRFSHLFHRDSLIQNSPHYIGNG